jgi:DNA-binding NarL/FixJ family response regulator
MIRVILVERVPLFRVGLRITLERFGEFLILESTDSTEILEWANEHHPDVVILDAGLPATDPLELTWMLRQATPSIGILILAASQHTSSEDEEQLFQFFRHGANAFEFRSITPDMLVESVHRVACGEYLIGSEGLLPRPSARIMPALKTRLHREMSTSEDEEPVSTFPLSGREVEILDHIARGSSNKEIAKSLKISDQTVKNHITSILKKLSVDDRTAAVVYALRRHWISLESPGAAGDSVAAGTAI